MAGHRAQQLLLELPIEIDPETAERCWGASFELAAEFGLTVYDAAYLELALRREATLATADRALAAASRQAGVPLLTGDSSRAAVLDSSESVPGTVKGAKTCTYAWHL